MTRHNDSRLWVAICVFAVLLLLLVLCGISFGATGPQEYIYRAFVRSHSLSDSSLYVNGTKGDIIRCFSVSLTDTTAGGVDQTYTADVRHNWRFAMPDSAQICDCYEVAGSPDSLLWYHVRLPGKGFKIAGSQVTTDTRGRSQFTKPVRVDTLAVGAIVSRASNAATVTGDTLKVYQSMRVANKLQVQGAATLGNAAADAIAINGNATLAGTSAHTGAATFAGAVTLGDAAGDAITSTGNFTASGTLTTTGAATFNGAVTLGDASGDAITVTGTPTITPTLTLNGQLAAGNDSTDTATFAGAPKFTNFCKTFTYPSGVTSTTFTWTGCGTWYYFGGWPAGGGKAFGMISKTSANTITATLATTLAASATCWICAIKP